MQFLRSKALAGDQPGAAAISLLRQSSRLARLLMRSGTRDLTRTEAGVLRTLTEGPLSIGELADSEAVAQPTMSRLVEKLACRGLVARRRQHVDGRVVLVSITPEGAATLDRTTDHMRALLSRALCDLADEDMAALIAAGGVLEHLIHWIQGEGSVR